MNNPNTAPTRAGRYVPQVGGYHAFVPAQLPPDPPIEVSGELQSMLSRADQVLGRLDGSIYTLPNPDLFVYMYVRNEAVLSSQIEGTQSSLHDLLSAEASVFAPDQPKDVDEVVNYVGAMNHGLEQLTELPVSVRLVREIHTRLLQGVRGSGLAPGEIRNSQNWIGGATVQDAVFVPPPPLEVLPALGALERFIHYDGSLPLLIKIGLVHSQFETIHPFLDGNGRIGRLLITLLLCENSVLQKPVLYLSHYFKQHREQYYDELQSVRDAGTWVRWLTFFLRGVIEVGEQAVETARCVLALREEHRNQITEEFGRAASNGHRVLEHLYQHPVVSVKEVQVITGTSYPAANNLMQRMEQSGILVEMLGRSRNRAFMYTSYVNLFA